MTELVLLITSTIIGAGFATGAELVTFFGATYVSPFVIALIYGVFSMVIIWVLQASKVQFTFTKHIFTAVYFVFFVVMTAGLVHLGGRPTTIAALGFCIAVVFCGYSKMLVVNKYLMMFVLGILFVACITNLTPRPQIAETTSPRYFFAIWQGLLYAGLNCTILGVAIPEMLKINSRRRVLMSSVIAITLVCVFIILILTAIDNADTVADMPILELSNNLITRVAMYFAILTSMIICLYNTAPKSGRNGVWVSILICAVAFALAFFGFKTILGFFYPLVGLLMICYVGVLGLGLLYRRFFC